MNCLSDLIIRLSQDPVVKEALAKMVIEVLNDPEVMREATKAALVLIARPEITKVNIFFRFVLSLHIRFSIRQQRTYCKNLQRKF